MPDSQISDGLKQQLAQLAESYAAARASGDVLLMQFATAQLSQFLQGVTLAPIGEGAPEQEAADVPVEAEAA